MTDNIDFSVNNYTIEELLDIFGIEGSISQNEIIEHGSEMIEKYRKNKKIEYCNFFSAAINKLLSNYHTVESFFAMDSDEESLDGKEGFIGGPITQKQQEQQEQQEELQEEQNPQPEQSKKPINKKYVINVGGKKEYILPAENMWQYNQYQTQTTRNKLNQYTMPQRRDNIKVPMALDHAVQLPKKLLMPNTYSQVPFIQGGMNPALQNTYLTWVNVDSQFRTITNRTASSASNEYDESVWGSDVSSSTDPITGLPIPQIIQAGTSTDFIFTLEPPVTNVLSISVSSIEVPLNGYQPFSAALGNTTFDISFNWKSPGYYFGQEQLTELIETLWVVLPTILLHYFYAVLQIYFLQSVGNYGYWALTTDISGSTVRTDSKYRCLQIPDGNYNNSLATTTASITDSLDSRLRFGIGPIPVSADGVFGPPGTATKAKTFIDLIIDSILKEAGGTELQLIRTFITPGTGKMRIALNGKFDWWRNGLLPLNVTTASFRYASTTEFPQGTGELPFLGSEIVVPVCPLNLPNASALPPGNEALNIFGSFIYCWNEIVCNWAHTDIFTSFEDPAVPPGYIPVTPPSLTFEEFLKKQPGYEDLQLNSGWGINGFSSILSVVPELSRVPDVLVPMIIHDPAASPGLYLGVPTTTSGLGSGCTLNITVTNIAAGVNIVTSITVEDAGTQYYRSGDTITVAAADFAPPAAADLVISLTDAAFVQMIAGAISGATTVFASATYNGVPTTTGGSGSGCTLNITTTLSVPALTQPVTSITIAAAGSGYQSGDIITVAAADIGATSDLLITLISESFVPSVATSPYDFDPRTLQGYWHNQQSTEQYNWIGILNLDTTNFPPTPPPPPPATAAPFYPGTTYQSSNPHTSLILNPQIWDPTKHIGHVPQGDGPLGPLTSYVQPPPGPPPGWQTAVNIPACCPSFPLNQVQIYVLYYIQLILIPEAKSLYEKYWNSTYSPLKIPVETISKISTSTSFWLWGGGVCNYPPNSTGDADDIFAVLPWPFPFTFNWKDFTMVFGHAPISPLLRQQAVSPGFLGELPDFDIRWYDPDDPLKGNCVRYQCTTGTSQQTSKAIFPGRKLNANLGWSLGFKEKYTESQLHIADNDFNQELQNAIDFTSYAILDAGAFFLDASGNGIIIGAPPWHFYLNLICLSERARQTIYNKRVETFKKYDDHNGFPCFFCSPATPQYFGIWAEMTSWPEGLTAAEFIKGWTTPIYGVPLDSRPSALPSLSLTDYNSIAFSNGQQQSTSDISIAGVISGKCSVLWIGMEGACIVDLTGTNYLTLVVDDFQRSRYNGNMPGLPQPPSQEAFKIPSYYQRYMNSMPICVDASGNLTYQEGKYGPKKITRSCRLGTNNPNDIIDGSNNLTNAQKYTALQIQNHQKQKYQNQNTAPLVSNVLARVPVNRIQQQQNGLMIFTPTWEPTSGGRGLGRIYYGPITLKRLHVQLLDDLGNPIDISCGDMSFGLILERLYQF